MKKSCLIGQCVLVAAGALLLQSAPVFADEGVPPPPGRVAEHSRNFDWIQHTQHTLDELKGKLNLAPEQIAAWDTWSQGVIKNARQQIEQEKSRHVENAGKPKPAADGTTPERMERGIEHLRAEAKWMQEHLVQLEAALARTKTFYITLGTNQRTIFDLFWHKVYHRASGYDDGRDMHQHEVRGPGPMVGERESPTSGH